MLAGYLWVYCCVLIISPAVFSICALQYTTYKIPKGDQQSFYPFVFNDIMGLESKKGIAVDDVKLALKGHVKDGYKVQTLHMFLLQNEPDSFLLCSHLYRTYYNFLLTGFKFVFQFDPDSKLSEYNPFYNKYPKTNDKVHILVCVIDAANFSVMKDETKQKIRDIRMEASDLGDNTLHFLTDHTARKNNHINKM